MRPISFAQEPSDGERNAVLKWLREFNLRENKDFMQSLMNGAEEEFFLVARDPSSDSVLGGIMGSFLCRWLKVDIMAVSPHHRNEGVGRRLLEEAERLGIEKGCIYSYVDTMSFQAPEFYRQLGYGESGRLIDWDSHGHDKIFFTKTLVAPTKVPEGAVSNAC